MLIVLVVAFILLRPRLWVKNKTAKVIVDGRLSEDVKLFHGSDGRLLFYLKGTDRPEGDPFIFYANTGVFRCTSDRVMPLKIIAIAKQADPYCMDFYGRGK